MKKIALALIVCIAYLQTATSYAQKIRMGLQGTTSTNWYKPETPNYKYEGMRIGFSYGLITEFMLAEQYSFASGVNIVYTGGKISFPIAAEDDSDAEYKFKQRDYRLQYVEIPMTFKMKTREIGYNSYFARFGFGGGVNINAKADKKYFNEGNSSIKLEENVDMKSRTPLFRASMILGLGVEHSLGGTTVLVGGVNFNNGFTNMMKGRDYTGLRNQQARLNYIELTVGIIF